MSIVEPLADQLERGIQQLPSNTPYFFGLGRLTSWSAALAWVYLEKSPNG